MLVNTENNETYIAVPVEFTVKSTVLVKNANSQTDAAAVVNALKKCITLPQVMQQVGECRVLTDEKSITDAQNSITHGLMIDSDESVIWADVTIL